jgi:NAD(P) transhydrogenase subunit alpha
MFVAVLKETLPGEHRVALIPADLAAFRARNITVLVEHNAGERAGYTNAQYQDKGAVLASHEECLAQANILLTVRGTSQSTSQHTLIGLLDPLGSPEKAQAYAQSGCTAFAMELTPRTTRAQSMDVLSSMANLAGYKAVILAASYSPKIFPMMITAAGTLTPAKICVLGAGVAGLQAIATAKRLGAVVEAYDVRPEVKEQVQSVGGKFIELNLDTSSAGDTGGYAKAQSGDFYAQQQTLLASHMQAADILITTAAIPGKKAPVLVPASTVERLKPGSVIIDLAAETGGNCALTQPGEVVHTHGVTILGPVNITSTMAYHASQLYSRNITAFVQLITQKDGTLHINKDDDIVKKTLVCQNGTLATA